MKTLFLEKLFALEFLKEKIAYFLEQTCVHCSYSVYWINKQAYCYLLQSIDNIIIVECFENVHVIQYLCRAHIVKQRMHLIACIDVKIIAFILYRLIFLIYLLTLCPKYSTK